MKKNFLKLFFGLFMVFSVLFPNIHLAHAEEETTKVEFHYHRENGDYDNWNVWTWMKEPKAKEGVAINFTDDDEYGKYFTIDLVNDPVLAGTTQLGFLIRKSVGASVWNERDISSDRFVDIPSTSAGGVFKIYLYQGISSIFYSYEDAMFDKIVYSTFQNTKTLNVKYMAENAVTASQFTLYENDVVTTNYTFSESAGIITIKFPEDANVTSSYRVKIVFPSGEKEMPCDISNLYDTDAFIEAFTYYGDDLGVSFNSDHTMTTFKVWAPIASSVTLNLYSVGSPGIYNSMVIQGSDTPVKRYVMHKEQQGVWAYTALGNLHGVYYTYSVKNGSVINEAVDPYAKSTGINGRRGLVVDFDILNEEIGFEYNKRADAIQNISEATIYEMHVRDLTIDETWNGSEENRGKFLGVVEEGTSYTKNGVTVKTGFDHIKELGVSHVQVMPVYDYNSVDESLDTGYNWGYDPDNYNALEGSYSSNPYDGLVKIKEFKEMTTKLNAAGIGVNMDVVYNHTAKSADSNFNLIVPNYYHRMTSSGEYSNGSGCGNEMASQRLMTRKFMVESTKFWFEEYNLSGFRFDLMGLIDTTTMSKIYQELSSIYDKAMVYGEPWEGGASTGNYTPSRQGNLTNVEGVGAFSDGMRNAIKGDNNPGSGFVQGIITGIDSILSGLMGAWSSYQSASYSPTKVINYVACHDNYTLYDHMKLTASYRNAVEMNKQADSFVLLSQGVSFIQLGQDFLRSKPKLEGIGEGDVYDHNSYKSGDIVNGIKWNEKIDNLKVFEYYQEVINIGRTYAEFNLDTREKINEQASVYYSDGVFIYSIKSASTEYSEIVVYFSLNNAKITLSAEDKVILTHEGKKDLTGLIEYQMAQNETIVVVK